MKWNTHIKDDQSSTWLFIAREEIVHKWKKEIFEKIEEKTNEIDKNNVCNVYYWYEYCGYFFEYIHDLMYA